MSYTTAVKHENNPYGQKTRASKTEISDLVEKTQNFKVNMYY